MNENYPSIGDVVAYYCNDGPSDQRTKPAIVTNFDRDWRVSLTVFHDSHIEHRHQVPYSRDGRPGTWGRTNHDPAYERPADEPPAPAESVTAAA